MIKNSSLWRTFYAAWDLACDLPLPAACRSVTDSWQNQYAFNALYAMPLWGALAGLAAVILGKLLNVLLPVNGSALVFAAAVMICSELRTSSRALALNVTFFENIIGKKSFAEAQMARLDSLRSVAGLVPLLLAIFFLAGKFAAVFLIARTGHYGVAAAALVITLSGEAVLAAEPGAVNVPDICRAARTEYIVAIGGFLLLFNLIFLPLSTLVVTGISAAVCITMLNCCLRKSARITSNDITMTGGMLEFIVWVVTAVMIG